MGFLGLNRKKLPLIVVSILLLVLLTGIFINRSVLGEFFSHKGKEYFSQGDYGKAESNFKRATVLNPDKSEYFVYLGYSYHQQKDKRAEEAYQKALSMDYETPIFYASLGRFYEIEKNDKEQAINYYKKAIEIEPPQYTDAYYHLVDIFLLLNRKEEAIPVAERLASFHPTAEAFILLGTVYSRNGRFKEAEESVRKAIELEPENAVWVARLGRLFLSKGEIAKAIEELEKSLSLDPLNEEPLCTLAYIYTSKQADYKKAIFYAEEVLKKVDEGKEVNERWLLTCLYNLGSAYLNLNQKAEAKAIFERYIPLAEKKPLYDKGYLDDAKKKLQELSQ